MKIRLYEVTQGKQSQEHKVLQVLLLRIALH